MLVGYGRLLLMDQESDTETLASLLNINRMDWGRAAIRRTTCHELDIEGIELSLFQTRGGVISAQLGQCRIGERDHGA